MRNSTEKGDSFEQQVYDAVKRELETGVLGLMLKTARLYHKREYYSQMRQKGIVFDLAIEVTRPGADDWAFLWLWECKSAEKPVPIDDVEEFYVKVQQVAPTNSKGCLVSKSGFQRSSIAFAQSAGISLARYIPRAPLGFLNRILESRPISNLPSENVQTTEKPPPLEADAIYQCLLGNVIERSCFYGAREKTVTASLAAFIYTEVSAYLQ